MIISISPPSSVPLRRIEKLTWDFFNGEYLIHKSKVGLLATSKKTMVLVKKREILLSFSSDDINAINLLKNYLGFVFNDVIVGVDLDNPVTDNLSFIVNFTKGIVS